MSDQQQSPSFSIEKLYVKDLSLEVPMAPHIYTMSDTPDIEMEMDTNARQLDEGVYEAIITITVTAKLGERVVFLAEATQGGVFTIQNVEEGDLSPILGIACPNILFPYVREVISDLVVRGGFPPILLKPINFEQVYMQNQAQAGTDGQDAPATLQ